MQAMLASHPIQLDHLADVTYHIREFVDVGPGPRGHLIVHELQSALVEGERLRGSMKGTSADWMTVAGGIASLDVRFVLETHDAALVSVQYSGRVDLSGGLENAVAYAAPIVHTDDERYRWLNAVVAVGKATLE